jgi:hypothetical protein
LGFKNLHHRIPSNPFIGGPPLRRRHVLRVCELDTV